MKRILCTVAALMVATMAFAGAESKMGDMTPQQAMDKMTNCPVCSVWMQDPALGPTVRHSVYPTKTGYVETLATVDQAMMPAFQKAEAECDKRAGSIPTMSADQKAKLCPICTGHVKFMDRKDVTVENFKTDVGVVTVASASTPEGVKALHEYAKLSQEYGALMAKAGTDPSKEPMKSKM
jgi:hypothetical protein